MVAHKVYAFPYWSFAQDGTCLLYFILKLDWILYAILVSDYLPADLLYAN